MKPALLLSARGVSEALATVGLCPDTGGPLALDRAWPRGDEGLSAVYTDGRQRWAVHTGKLLTRSEATGRTRRGSAHRLEALDAWAHSLEGDPELAALADALDAREAGCRLARWLRSSHSMGPPRVVTYKPLRRCVLAYGRGELFVKLFRRRDRPGVEARYRLLAAEGRLGTLRLAPPDGVLQPWNALVWRASKGELLTYRLREPLAETWVARVGSGLAALQSSGAAWSERHGSVDELATLSRWVTAVGHGEPEVFPRLARIRDALSNASPPAALDVWVPAHRDFHDGQLIAHGDHLTLLDLDTAGLAAPELDAGNFLAHLRLRELQGCSGSHTALAAAFCAGYRERAPGSPRTAVLKWYEACALLRLACVYAFRPVWGHISEELARAAENRAEWLEREAGGNPWV